MAVSARESDLVRSVVDALDRVGVLAMRLQSGRVRVRGAWMQLCPEGTPDLLCMLRGGRVVWLELKRDKASKPSEAQEAWHHQARSLGHEVRVVRTAQEAIDAVRLPW